MIATDERINRILDQIIEIARGNLDVSISPSAHKDEIDGIMLGLNMLTQELKYRTISKEHVDRILRFVADILIVTDRAGIIERVNRAAIDTLGYSENELIGKDISILIGQNHFNLETIAQGNFKDIDTQLQSKDGEKIHVMISGTCLHNKDGSISSFIISAKDTRELRVMQAQLVQSAKLASLGQMSSGVAHELNNPLTLVKGNNSRLKSLLAKHGSISPEHAEEFIREIDENCNRMKLIIQHLRDFSRESGHNREAISINDIVTRSFKLLSEQLRLQNIRVEMHLSSHSPKLKVNSLRLEQVFVNLLTNAADAISSRPGAVQGTIRASTSVLGDFVTVSFSDNGTGIPQDILNRIFDPFFTTKEVGKGTGLGLSISHGIIKEHGGEIMCESTLGEGTTFHIILPIESGKEKGADNYAKNECVDCG